MLVFLLQYVSGCQRTSSPYFEITYFKFTVLLTQINPVSRKVSMFPQVHLTGQLFKKAQTQHKNYERLKLQLWVFYSVVQQLPNNVKAHSPAAKQ